MKRGRKTKLTPEVQKIIVEDLTVGNTIETACSRAGITYNTFYLWRNKGEAVHNGEVEIADDNMPFYEFFQAVTQAQVAAFRAAALTVRGAYTPGMPFSPRETVEKRTEKTVTKLRKIEHPDGSIEEIPYQETTVTVHTEEKVLAPDWRAAIEYLKRRDPTSWNTPMRVQHSSVDQSAQALIDYIKEHRPSFEAVAQGLNSYTTAEMLFREAGINVQYNEKAGLLDGGDEDVSE